MMHVYHVLYGQRNVIFFFYFCPYSHHDYYRIVKPVVPFMYDYSHWCWSIQNADIKDHLLSEIQTYITEDNLEKHMPISDKEKNCEKEEHYFNPMCILNRARKVGKIIKQDSDKMVDSSSEEKRLLYDLWKTHPYVRELCPELHKNVDYTSYFKELSKLEISELSRYAKVISKAQGLLKEENEVCSVKEKRYDSFCSLETLLQFVDLENKLFSKKDNFYIKIYKDAARLQFLTLKLNNRNRYKDVKTVEKSLPLIKRITEVLLFYMVRDDLKGLSDYTSYLPPVGFYKCGLICDSKEVYCMFTKVMTQSLMVLRQQFRKDDTRRDFKFIQSSVDHKQLLHQNMLTRILDVLASQMKSSTAIARYMIKVFKKNLETEMAKVKNAIIKNTNDRFTELKKYFQSMHSFDAKIAQGDLKLIIVNVASLKDTLETVTKQVNHEVNSILETTIGLMLGEVLYRYSRMYVGFFSWIFGGGFDLDQQLDNAEELARALKGVNRATSLRTILPKIADKTKEINKQLTENNDKLNKMLKDVIEKVQAAEEKKEKKMPDFSEHRDKFLKLYNEYQPTLGTSDIVQLGAFWMELVTEACEIMINENQISTSNQIYCVTSKVAIERLTEVYIELYDFQFEMLDALALYMRSQSGMQAAESINTQFEVYSAPDIKIDEEKLDNLDAVADCSLITYMVQVYINVKAYCVALQYKNGGEKPNACQGFQTNVPWLTSLDIPTCDEEYHMILNALPTKPSRTGDTAFVDLAKLYRGEPVTFKIPDSQWLVDHKWIEKSQQNKAFYVKQFEVYLPTQLGKETRISVEAKTVGGSVIKEKGDKFLIEPAKSLGFTYSKGPLNTCRQQSFTDPYKICRNTKTSFDEICPLTVTKTDSTRLYPGIYSKWEITLKGFGNQPIPKVASDFQLAIGLKICLKSPQQSQKKATRRKRAALIQKRASIRNCCTDQGQFYWNMKKEACIECPKETKSALDGYYCSSQ